MKVPTARAVQGIWPFAVLILTGASLAPAASAQQQINRVLIRSEVAPDQCLAFSHTYAVGNQYHTDQPFALEPCEELDWLVTAYVTGYLVSASKEEVPKPENILDGSDPFLFAADCLTLYRGFASTTKRGYWTFTLENFFDPFVNREEENEQCTRWRLDGTISGTGTTGGKSAGKTKLCITADMNAKSVSPEECDGRPEQQWIMDWQTGAETTAQSGSEEAPEEPPKDPNIKDPATGDTELHHLARDGKVDQIQDALDRGGNLDIRNNSGQTPVDVAVRAGRDGTIIALLVSDSEQNSDVLKAVLGNGSIGDETVSAIIDAGGTVDDYSFGVLLRRGASQDVIDRAIATVEDPDEALSTAVVHGNIDVARRLISERNARPKPDAMSTAARKGSIPLATLLLDNGGDVNVLLDHAVRGGDKVEMVELALEYGATPTVEQTEKAANSGHIEVYKLLAGSGAAISERETGEVFRRAILREDRAMLSNLARSGARLDDATISWLRENLEMLSFLLDEGATNTGAVMVNALRRCSYDVVAMLYGKYDVQPQQKHLLQGRECDDRLQRLFAEQGLQPEQATIDQAMMGAIKTNDSSKVTQVLDRGVSAEPMDYIVFAAEVGASGSALMLLNNGARGDWILEDGTPLIHKFAEHCADEWGQATRVLETLMETVDINMTDPNGDTALHVAARRSGCARHIESLISTSHFRAKGRLDLVAEIDVNAHNNAGQTPLDVARSGKIKKVLKKAGGVRGDGIARKSVEADGSLPREGNNFEYNRTENSANSGQDFAYTKTENAAISGHNTQTKTGVTVDACKRACSSATWCKSFDYNKNTAACDLSDKSKYEVLLKTNYPGNPYDHYSKVTVDN